MAEVSTSGPKGPVQTYIVENEDRIIFKQHSLNELLEDRVSILEKIHKLPKFCVILDFRSDDHSPTVYIP